MCIGECEADTLNTADQSFLRLMAADTFPDHTFSVRSNEDGMIWVVLEPAVVSPVVLRFTICRIDPCFMVRVEDRGRRQRFCSLTTIEDAVGFLRNATDEAVLAVMNAHPASPVLQ